VIRAKNYETVPKFVKVMARILWPLFSRTVVVLLVSPLSNTMYMDWTDNQIKACC